MSIEALSHVLSLENVGDSTRKLVLLGLANHAHKDGTAAWSGTALLATYANCSPRTVTRHIGALLDSGHIREGDQGLVGHIRGDRRPIVYEVALDEATRVQWATERASGAPSRRDVFVAAGQEAKKARGDDLSGRDLAEDEPADGSRGDTGDLHGVTPVTPRGDTGVTQTVLEPSLEPSESSLRSDSAGSPTPGAEAVTVALLAAESAKAVDTSLPLDTKAVSGESSSPSDLDTAARAVATAYYEWYEREVGPVMKRGSSSPYMALVKNIVRPALAAGYTDVEIRHALAQVRMSLPSWQQYERALTEVRTGITQGRRAPANIHHDDPADPTTQAYRAQVNAAWGATG